LPAGGAQSPSGPQVAPALPPVPAVGIGIVPGEAGAKLPPAPATGATVEKAPGCARGTDRSLASQAALNSTSGSHAAPQVGVPILIAPRCHSARAVGLRLAQRSPARSIGP
jgi:hypothetical protein